MPFELASAEQVSVEETITQLLQSEIVLFGAVVGGSTRYAVDKSIKPASATRNFEIHIAAVIDFLRQKANTIETETRDDNLFKCRFY
jgi:hypothetical protein